MTSCSRAQIKMAETRPPSWPDVEDLGIGGPGEDDVPGDAGHLVARSAPARTGTMSISVSQVRKRGQARVHIVQPFTPWVQSSGPPSSSTFHGR